MMFLRLRLAQRLGLLGPIVQFERRVETWAAQPAAGRLSAFAPAPPERS
jgi:hypothetical protein